MERKTRKRDINNLDEIDEPSTSVNVHGAITTISPVKKGRKTVFFDATLADTTSKVRLVGFSPQQQLIFIKPVQLWSSIIAKSSTLDKVKVMTLCLKVPPK